MADQVVVMSEAARQRLCARIRRGQPQGHHDPARRDRPDRACAKRPSRPTLLTWGLLGPGKGVERVIDSMTFVEGPARPATLSGRRPDAPEGPCRRR